ncbi:endonuclease [Brevundimonas sp. Leaf363]|uniref:endonuclease/exonuclease/phosphatase family protein n=1 Tax=Brevundimonas sp. Leaf363 TaxID=1736353 RepID=UPI0006FC5DEC|nr:endonuclease/exonuclease/phosphatase family protein [Brevundimonas sp. Leaf363]KQS56553.1 endonuclease [Brevundimonas sp. Leaf363]
MTPARLVMSGLALLGLGAPMAIGLAALSGIGHRWVDILAQFTAPALLVAAVIVAGSLALRLWIAAGAAGLTLLVLILAFWAQVPSGGSAQAGPSVRLYWANLYAANADVEAIDRSITKANADIIMITELGAAPDAQIESLLRAYPHRAVGPRVDGLLGPNRSLIASRWPLTGKTYGVRWEDPPVSAVAETPIGPVSLIAVHLTRPWPYQYQWGQITQTIALTERASTLPRPMIVAGDFNSVSSARIGRQIRRDNGLIAAPGWPGSWPAALPGAARINIDQIYRSPDLAFVRRSLGAPTGSDHRPVIVEIRRARPA